MSPSLYCRPKPNLIHFQSIFAARLEFIATRRRAGVSSAFPSSTHFTNESFYSFFFKSNSVSSRKSRRRVTFFAEIKMVVTNVVASFRREPFSRCCCDWRRHRRWRHERCWWRHCSLNKQRCRPSRGCGEISDLRLVLPWQWFQVSVQWRWCFVK